MLAAPAAAPATPSAPLVRMQYVMRAPASTTRTAEIDAFVADPASARRVEGSFADAVRVAQAAASFVVRDGLHQLDVNPAQAVLDAGDGAWLVAPVVGDHRGAVGPIFIDGDFFRRVGLAVWGERLPGGTALQAIVGVDSLVDLRNSRATGATIPISRA